MCHFVPGVNNSVILHHNPSHSWVCCLVKELCSQQEAATAKSALTCLYCVKQYVSITDVWL